MQLIIMLVFGVITALIAHHKGRSAIGWFFIGGFFTLIGLIIALVVGNLAEQERRDDQLRRENRRLREQLRKDRLVADSRHRESMRRLDAHDRVAGIDTISVAPDALLEGGRDPAEEEEAWDDDADPDADPDRDYQARARRRHND